MKRTPTAAAIAALFLMASSTVFAQGAGTSGGSTATTGRSGANATATGSTATGAAVPGPAAADRSSTTTARADTKAAGAKLARGDRKFIENAAEGGMMEVEMGRVVADKASDPAVKQFADRMVKDHGDANKKLTDLAQSKGVTPPAELKRGDRKDVDKMAKMAPDKLDRAYMDDMVKDHKKDVKEFEKASKNAKDPEVKKFAADTLPTLQEHLKLAQDTQSKLKGGGSAATRSSSATGAGTSGSGSPATPSGATTSAGMGKDTGAKK